MQDFLAKMWHSDVCSVELGPCMQRGPTLWALKITKDLQLSFPIIYMRAIWISNKNSIMFICEQGSDIGSLKRFRISRCQASKKVLSLGGPLEPWSYITPKSDSLLDLVDTREAKEVSANNQPSGFVACVLNGMKWKLNDNNKMNP